MHHIFNSQLSPTTLRAALVATVSAICVMALGFAPVPQLWYFLVGGVLVVTVTFATGPKPTDTSVALPSIFIAVIPALLPVVFRNTSLIWAITPVLAFVTAAATWMLVTNRYPETTVEEAVKSETTDRVFEDELAPKREEKTAVTNDDSSATAA